MGPGEAWSKLPAVPFPASGVALTPPDTEQDSPWGVASQESCPQPQVWSLFIKTQLCGQG